MAVIDPRAEPFAFVPSAPPLPAASPRQIATHPVTGRPILQNEDGSIATEESITVTHPRLNAGQPTNIPSIWGGARPPFERDDPRFEDWAVEQALQSGQPFQAFSSVDEAVAAAQERSAMLGRTAGGDQEPAYDPVAPMRAAQDFLAQDPAFDYPPWLSFLPLKVEKETGARSPTLPASWRALGQVGLGLLGDVLPVAESRETGKTVPVVPPAAEVVIEATKLPGDVYAGRVDPLSDEGVIRAFDLAGSLASGGLGRAAGGSGLNEAGIFGGRLAKTANLDKLKRAEAMERAGEEPDYIWLATGWERGADGQWRFEIDDYRANLLPAGAAVSTAGERLEHPALFEAYPELRGVAVIEDALEDMYGFYEPREGAIGTIGLDPTSPEALREVLLHELQHAVQDIEGFSLGGSGADLMDVWLRKAGDEVKQLKKSGRVKEAEQLENVVRAAQKHSEDVAYNAYRALSSEVEARNAAYRSSMPPDIKALMAPRLTEEPGIPRDKQIVGTFSGSGPGRN